MRRYLSLVLALVGMGTCSKAYSNDECSDLQFLASLAKGNFEAIRGGSLPDNRWKATRDMPGFQGCQLSPLESRYILDCRSPFFKAADEATKSMGQAVALFSRCSPWQEGFKSAGSMSFIDPKGGVGATITSGKEIDFDLLRKQPGLNFSDAEKYRVRVWMSFFADSRSDQAGKRGGSETRAAPAAAAFEPKTYKGLCEPLKKAVALVPDRFAPILASKHSYGWSTAFRLPDLSRCYIGELSDTERYLRCRGGEFEHEGQARQEHAALTEVVRGCLQVDWTEEAKSPRSKRVFGVDRAAVEVHLRPPSSSGGEWTVSLDVGEP